MGKTIFHRDELELIVAFAGCTLDEKPGSNWVQSSGGLPTYICEVARAIKRSGRTTAQAISIAVSRMKKWATGVGVNTDTQAKAAKALAEWEALRAKSHAKSAAKKAGHTLAATNTDDLVLYLAATTDFSMCQVRSAFEARQAEIRRTWMEENPDAHDEAAPPALWVREVWTTYLIVGEGYGSGGKLYKIPYTVDTSGEVTFEAPALVKTEYVVIEDSALDGGEELTDEELQSLMEMSDGRLQVKGQEEVALSNLHRVLSLAQPGSALAKVLALAADLTPYGKVTYADPGYQADKQKRYPIDTAEHCRAAWSYINQERNSSKYTATQLRTIKNKIKAAATKCGITISDGEDGSGDKTPMMNGS
jgi:hypothetical protein